MRPTGITVATYNLYLGADLTPLFAAEGSESLARRAATMWSAVEASRPVKRMSTAAALLLRHLPDVIGVQEAALWRAGTTESVRTHDLLDLFVKALAVQGTPYRVVAQSSGFASGDLSSTLASITGQVVEMQDRCAILVRDDPAIADGESFGGRFDAAMASTVIGHPVEVARGWCAVDVRVGRAELRVVNAHFEAFDAAVRTAQATQLVTEVIGAEGNRATTVVLGDINCRPPGCRPTLERMPAAAHEVDGDAYEVLAASGLIDAWAAVQPSDPCGGHTSGQAADLRNPVSTLDQRIDVVFADPALAVRQVDLVGAHQDDRTSCGLWASDHACLVVGLEA